jgi:NAD(P)-dependent dehydrogenase (short-subunit alcohol dehydrogenase family)
MENTKIVLITGANKGLGFGMVQNLSKNHPEFKVILASRDLNRGNQALAQLEGVKNVDVLELDVDSDIAVQKAVDTVKQKYGGLDILVNNAGILVKGDAIDESIARWTIGTNYYGTVRVTEAFLPLLKNNASIMNVSSRRGRLAFLGSDELKARFLSPTLSTQQLSDLMEEFSVAVGDGTFVEKGWPQSTSAYSVSKIGMSMYTRILARDYPQFKVNACCPGWCRTDMTGEEAELSIEQGVETLVPVALFEDSKKTGKFWYEMKEHDWE